MYPHISTKYVSGEWKLRRCVCGDSFGCKAENSASCPRCGSSRSKIIASFDDSRQLADAVSSANLPKEIANDLTKKIQSKERKSRQNSKSANLRSIAIQAMYDATDESGIISIHSLEKELSKKGITENTPQHLIGQAEIEGILLRHGDESWTWLQQSS